MAGGGRREEGVLKGVRWVVVEGLLAAENGKGGL